jgi:hypothetical protein
MILTPCEHRLHQVLLHFGPAPTDLLALVIANGRPLRKSHPLTWLRHLRRKLGRHGIAIVRTPQGYRIHRGGPLRDRAAYMKDYRARVGRASRAKVRK